MLNALRTLPFATPCTECGREIPAGEECYPSDTLVWCDLCKEIAANEAVETMLELPGFFGECINSWDKAGIRKRGANKPPEIPVASGDFG